LVANQQHFPVEKYSIVQGMMSLRNLHLFGSIIFSYFLCPILL